MTTFESVSLLVSTLLSILAIVVAWLTQHSQAAQNLKIGERQSDLQKEIHIEQQALSLRLHSDERLQAQRQAFIDIWPVISGLHAIDPSDIRPRYVVENVNALELVALCWEGKMVDLQLIRRTFRSRYVEMFEAIQKLSAIPGLSKDGQGLLNENPAAQLLYRRLKEEEISRDEIQ